MILCSNPKMQYLSHKSEIDEAIMKVLDGGRYILGEQVQSFEREFCNYIGVKHGVGVGSGTEALHIALKACDVGLSDEVITVSHTAVATIAAIRLSGAVPVFVDIDINSYTIDPEKLKDAITAKTKAIIVVHIYGHPADMNPIMELAQKFNIKVIEDCAQSTGASYNRKKVGSIGDISCFSFYPTKNLGAIGDGGMILTNSVELFYKCRLLREYGWKERYISEISGWNSRLDEIQAAILRIKLKYLDVENEARIRIAGIYNNNLTKNILKIPLHPNNCKHVYHLYVIQLKNRDAMMSFLNENEIQTSIHYPVPVHQQPAYKTGYQLEVTERIAKDILSLPIYPELAETELNVIIETINNFNNDRRG